MNHSIPQYRERHKRGFTLIELLVVIAIISLLVSILVPSLTKAKELAQRTVCLSNLHNFAFAVAQYQHDYNDLFPPSGIDVDWNGVNPRWYCALLPYVNPDYYGKTISLDDLTNEFDSAAWWCPVAPAELQLNEDRQPRSYAYNPYLHMTNSPNIASSINVGGADKTPVLYDNRDWLMTAWLLSQPGLWNDFYRDSLNRHNEGGNFLFVDGHVTWIPELDMQDYAPSESNEYFHGNTEAYNYWL